MMECVEPGVSAEPGPFCRNDGAGSNVELNAMGSDSKAFRQSKERTKLCDRGSDIRVMQHWNHG